MIEKKLDFQANCKTTAMGIMPHTSMEKAMSLSLSLDIPFCPQLPNINFFEDMYVQASHNFPGIVIDSQAQKIAFDNARFEAELRNYSEKMADEDIFAISQDNSVTYQGFLAQDLRSYAAIRGQLTGPVSFGFRVTDEESRPIIYNEGIRALLFDFIQRKFNLQYRQLKEKNRNAFVWLDEPGLGWVFSGFSGYSDIQAKQEYQSFLAGLDGPRALHLCASVNLPYLLSLGLEILSFDAYRIELMPKGYTGAITNFLKSGGIISWGIVPTDSVSLEKETPATLARLLSNYWEVVTQNTGISTTQIAGQALLAPSSCCLKNIGKVGAVNETSICQDSGKKEPTTEERLVEKAFLYLKELSEILKGSFQLP